MHFADAGLLSRKMNAHIPAELARTEQAIAQLGEALKTRPPMVRRTPWHFSDDDMAFGCEPMPANGSPSQATDQTARRLNGMTDHLL